MSSIREFIEVEIKKRRQDYLSSPAYILEHYNLERQNIEAYNGRQLLEMLQNADDASETATDKRVLIRLTEQELTISNNGIPFSVEGFCSIMYSNLSPKVMLQNQIGQKGLGFRSVLSWAEEVIISSGGVQVAFSEAIARNFLKNLLNESDKVKNYLKKNSKSDWPIATLRIPKLLEEDYSLPEFDTTIRIRLKESIREDVRHQVIGAVNKATLIFLNNTECIEVDCEGEKAIYTKSYENEEKSRVKVEEKDINTGIAQIRIWNVKRRNGEHQGKNFGLAVAWTDQLEDEENLLYSFFRTKVRFPFPALLHGTFELSQDRNNLIRDTEGHNRFLTEQLADFLVETALEIGSRLETANYLPLKLLNIDFEKIDILLQEYGFEEILLNKIKEKPVFPNVNGRYISLKNQPVDYEQPVAEVLRGEGCEDLLLYDSDKSLLKRYQLYKYSLEDFIRLVAKRLRNLAVSDIALLYYHILIYYKPDLQKDDFVLKQCMPFLIDNEGEIIPWESTVFIEPDDEVAFKFPKKVKISFFNRELLEGIKTLYEADEEWFNEEWLSLLGIHAYSVEEIAGMLVQYFKDLKLAKAEKNKELHKILFKLYKNEAKRGATDALPEEVEIPVLTKNGTIQNAAACYLGKEYGCELTEKLYARAHDRLVVAPERFGFTAKKAGEVKEYLHWLGVSDLPKYKLETKRINKNDRYFQYYLHSFSYPLRKWEWTFHSYSHLLNWIKSDHLELQVGVFDDFDRILEGITPEIVFSWIKCDSNLAQTLRKNEEILRESGLTFYNNRTWKRSEGRELLSYTRWQLSRFAFIPVVSSDKEKVMPDKCCLSKTITKGLSPFIEKPAVNMKKMSARLSFSENELEEYLNMVGVHRDVSTFSVPVLYDILMQLYMLDRAGEVAPRIYREIINHYDEKRIDPTFEKYNDFIRNGRILCKIKGQLKYVKVWEALYLPTKKYAKNLLKYFPLAVFDSKQGSRRIEKLFGVKTLKGIRFSLTASPKPSLLNRDFQQELWGFKALVYVLRKDMDARHSIAFNLKNAEITLVEKMQASFIQEGEAVSFDLENFEYINTSSRQFYILIPGDVESLNDLRNNDAFCQSLSEIFGMLLETESYTDFVHDLYGKPERARETRILSFLEKEGREDIEEAMKLMNVTDDVRLLFWKAFSNAGSRQLKADLTNESELKTFFMEKMKLSPDKMDLLLSLDFYNNLLEGSYDEREYAVLHELFVRFKIDFSKFSLYFNGWDFSEYFKYQFVHYQQKYKEHFSCKLFRRLQSDERKQSEFFGLLEDYNQLKYRKTDGFVIDVKAYFFERIYKEFGIRLEDRLTLFSVDKRLEQNQEILRAKGIEIPDTLMEDKHIQSLLLFGEEKQIEKAIRQYQHKIEAEEERRVEIEEPTGSCDAGVGKYRHLAERILQHTEFQNLPLEYCNITNIAEDAPKKERSHRKQRQRRVHFDQSDKEETGFIAELLCYHKLVKELGEENVKWVSENAFRADPNKFMTGEAGLGYDMELIIDSKVHYIEVKGCTALYDGIHMSHKELHVALEYPEIYDLMIVENPHENPEFKYIKCPFRFNKLQGETLFSNSRFTLLTDSYRLKFNWGDSE